LTHHPAPKPSPKVAHLRAQVGAHQRHHGRTDQRTVDAVRELREAKLAEHIKKVVDQAPPLTGEQRTRLAALLRPAELAGGDAA
jgi:hypothetical protein